MNTLPPIYKRRSVLGGLLLSFASAASCFAQPQSAQNLWNLAGQEGQALLIRIADTNKRISHLKEEKIRSMSAEDVLRAIVQANEDCDLPGMARLMAHDEDAVNYTINGRKYVGWDDLARDMKEEFDAVEKLELPLKEMKVWTKGDFAWFAMELDYIRYTRNGDMTSRIVMPLRETGVLQKRRGEWKLIAWHESFRTISGTVEAEKEPESQAGDAGKSSDLSGSWDILEVEGDRRYVATLDATGNGPYTWQEGRFTTVRLAGRKWEGTWKQPGNDNEGGFEVTLSADGASAKGIWWYTRAGKHKFKPGERYGGGTYSFKRR